jgi:hypothetical protein
MLSGFNFRVRTGTGINKTMIIVKIFLDLSESCFLVLKHCHQDLLANEEKKMAYSVRKKTWIDGRVSG